MNVWNESGCKGAVKPKEWKSIIQKRSNKLVLGAVLMLAVRVGLYFRTLLSF